MILLVLSDISPYKNKLLFCFACNAVKRTIIINEHYIQSNNNTIT